MTVVNAAAHRPRAEPDIAPGDELFVHENNLGYAARVKPADRPVADLDALSGVLVRDHDELRHVESRREVILCEQRVVQPFFLIPDRASRLFRRGRSTRRYGRTYSINRDYGLALDRPCCSDNRPFAFDAPLVRPFAMFLRLVLSAI